MDPNLYITKKSLVKNLKSYPGGKKKKRFAFITETLRLCLVTQFVRVSFYTPKGSGLHSQSGNILRMQVQFLVKAYMGGK